MEIATPLLSLATFLGIVVTSLSCPKIRIKAHYLDTYWIIAIIGAVLLLLFRLVPIDVVWQGLTNPSPMNPVKILVLFFSMTIISIFLDEAGLFRFLASVASKKAGASQTKLFFIVYGLTAILTIFTSNDIVVLTFTPFLCLFCKNAKINPLPFLIAEFVSSNTYSMMLLIGNPTNIYLGTSADISFIDYVKVMAVPTLLAGAVETLVVYLVFRKKLNEPMQVETEEAKIESKPDLILGLTALISCLTAFILSNYLPMEMWLIALSVAGALLVGAIIIRLVTHKHWSYLGGSLKRLPYPLIPFVLSMFVVVSALSYQGIAEKIGSFLNQMNPVWSYGISSFLAANVINNIPMSILYSDIVGSLSGQQYLQATYASIIGSNLGAFLTPLGALAGIMFSGLLSRHDVPMSFLKFCKYGVIIAIPTIITALAALQLMV